MMGRQFFHLGGRAFYPPGEPAARIRFREEGAATLMAIEDPAAKARTDVRAFRECSGCVYAPNSPFREWLAADFGPWSSQCGHKRLDQESDHASDDEGCSPASAWRPSICRSTAKRDFARSVSGCRRPRTPCWIANARSSRDAAR